MLDKKEHREAADLLMSILYHHNGMEYRQGLKSEYYAITKDETFLVDDVLEVLIKDLELVREGNHKYFLTKAGYKAAKTGIKRYQKRQDLLERFRENKDLVVYGGAVVALLELTLRLLGIL